MKMRTTEWLIGEFGIRNHALYTKLKGKEMAFLPNSVT